MTFKKRKIILKKQKKTRLFLKAILFIIPAFLLVFVFFYLKATRKFWNGKDKLAIAVSGRESIKIVVFDPSIPEIVQVVIPGNTETEVAQGLGVFKLSSVWELGKKEKLEGRLLVRTLAKHFKFPVYIWADSEASFFWESNPFDLARAIFLVNDTNLGLGDKVSLGLFALGVTGSQKREIKLEDTGYIKRVILSDGKEGFKVNGKIPQNLAILFSGNGEDNIFWVKIQDESGLPFLAEDLGTILEVMGGKVISIERSKKDGSESNFVCRVKGREDLVEKIIEFLPCSLTKDDAGRKLDLEISIGKFFMDEY